MRLKRVYRAQHREFRSELENKVRGEKKKKPNFYLFFGAKIGALELVLGLTSGEHWRLHYRH